MPLHIYTVLPVKLLHCICLFVLVSVAACSGGSSPTGTDSPISAELTSDDPTKAGPDTLTLNNNSWLVTASRNDLYKISALDGSTELVFEGGGGSWEFLTPVDVANDVAYISSTDNVLNAIDLNTGAVLWEFDELGISKQLLPC